MYQDSLFDFDKWIQDLDVGRGNDSLSELATQLQANRPSAPPIQTAFKHQLLQQLVHQFPTLIASSFISLSSLAAVSLAGIIIVVVGFVAFVNPPSDNGAGFLAEMTHTAEPTETSTITVTVTSTVTPTETVTISATVAVTPTISMTMTMTPPSLGGNCAYSQGYWKNHASVWPSTSLKLGDMIYEQDELLDLMNTPPRGDATLNLVHQLIAAKLNILQGADEAAVAPLITAADAWLIDNPIGSLPTGDGRSEGLEYAESFDDFNNGNLSVPHCSEPLPTSTPTITPTITGTITATVTFTPTVTPTATVMITSTPTMTGTTNTNCTGADPHPKGTQLSNEHGVSYDEIMGWFCSGYGFGEIDQAYGFAAEAGITADEVFEMRTSGMGWGQIRKELGVSPGNGNGNNGNGGNNGNNGNGGSNGGGNGNGNNGNGGNNGNNGNGGGNNGNNGNGGGNGGGNGRGRGNG